MCRTPSLDETWKSIALLGCWLFPCTQKVSSACSASRFLLSDFVTSGNLMATLKLHFLVQQSWGPSWPCWWLCQGELLESWSQLTSWTQFDSINLTHSPACSASPLHFGKIPSVGTYFVQSGNFYVDIVGVLEAMWSHWPHLCLASPGESLPQTSE